MKKNTSAGERAWIITCFIDKTVCELQTKGGEDRRLELAGPHEEEIMTTTHHQRERQQRDRYNTSDRTIVVYIICIHMNSQEHELSLAIVHREIVD